MTDRPLTIGEVAWRLRVSERMNTRSNEWTT